MKLSLNELFTDNAVLPHGKPFKVYGNGEGEVTVILNGAEVKTLCQNGAWSVTMPPMECRGPYELTAVCGSETVVLKNIYIGEALIPHRSSSPSSVFTALRARKSTSISQSTS